MTTGEADGRGLSGWIDVAGRYSWRFVGIGLAAWGAIAVLTRVRIVLLAILVAALLTTLLATPARFLRSHRWPPAAAALTVFLAFLALLVAIGFVVVPPVSRQFAELGPVIAEGIDDIKAWLVNKAPIDISQQRLDEFQSQLGQRARTMLTSGNVVAGAVMVVEAVAGALLALVTTFFFLKDGERFQAMALRKLPADRRDQAKTLAASVWRGLNGYVRGAAALGVLEGFIIGVTLFLVGAGLEVPVALLTFIAAFVPFVGAIVAGSIATLVALVTAGGTSALIVAGVAVAVQNLDNDLLAPVIYGKALAVHPLAILLSVFAAGSLAGAVGVFIAVPIVAVVSSVLADREALAETAPGGDGETDAVDDGESGRGSS